MKVDPKDGACRSCGGEVEITEADDATMLVECQDCFDSYLVEPDAYGDGAINYWPEVMARQELGDDKQ